jgi:hypothetical protein
MDLKPAQVQMGETPNILQPGIMAMGVIPSTYPALFTSFPLSFFPPYHLAYRDGERWVGLLLIR